MKKTIDIENLTFDKLSKYMQAECRRLLEGEDTEVDVIRWRGRIRVAGHVFPYEHSWDEKVLLTVRETDVFTEAERTVNYIGCYYRYPAWYKGKRDQAMLDKMRLDFLDANATYDPEHPCYKQPVGRMVGQDFVYTGEMKTVKA